MSSGTLERNWAKELARYREPRPVRSLLEIVVTAVPFLVFWAASLILVSNGQWWGMVFTIPTSLFLVRMFVIQHDCGHGSFFRRRPANDWVGRVIGVLTFTPYDYWRQTHAMHHAGAGNLDRRGVGDVHTLTVSEYWALSGLGRAWYRVYRNMFFLLFVGSFSIFVIFQRLPIGLMRSGAKPWVSTMGTNLAIVAVGAGLIIWFGFWAWLAVQAAVSLSAGAVGVWLFYVQHQFHDTYWATGEEWDFEKVALTGSSHYDLPGVLRWFSGNIGVHHVHHLASRIPFYRLRQVVLDHPELYEQGRLTIRQSLGLFRLTLWDEDRSKLVSFRDAAVSA